MFRLQDIWAIGCLGCTRFKVRRAKSGQGKHNSKKDITPNTPAITQICLEPAKRNLLSMEGVQKD